MDESVKIYQGKYTGRALILGEKEIPLQAGWILNGPPVPVVRYDQKTGEEVKRTIEDAVQIAIQRGANVVAKVEDTVATRRQSRAGTYVFFRLPSTAIPPEATGSSLEIQVANNAPAQAPHTTLPPKPRGYTWGEWGEHNYDSSAPRNKFGVLVQTDASQIRIPLSELTQIGSFPAKAKGKVHSSEEIIERAMRIAGERRVIIAPTSDGKNYLIYQQPANKS